MEVNFCTLCDQEVWPEEPQHAEYRPGTLGTAYTHIFCIEQRQAEQLRQAMRDREIRDVKVAREVAAAELERRTALDKALDVNRDEWQVGMEVYGYDVQNEQWRTWVVNSIDWDRAASPIVCMSEDEFRHVRYFNPWDLRKVPTSVEEIDAFLEAPDVRRQVAQSLDSLAARVLLPTKYGHVQVIQ